MTIALRKMAVSVIEVRVCVYVSVFVHVPSLAGVQGGGGAVLVFTNFPCLPHGIGIVGKASKLQVYV